MNRSSEDALLRSAKAGDAAALEAVWRCHRRWIAAVLLAHRVEPGDLDDLLQDVAVTVVGSIGGLKDPAALRAWLRTIALNAARTAGRRSEVRRREQRQLDEEELEDPGSRRTGRRVDASDTVELAMRHVDQLPPDLREPLLLRAVRGMSQREIARALDVPETTVETRLARARRALRRAVPDQHLLPMSRPTLANGTKRRTLS